MNFMVTIVLVSMFIGGGNVIGIEGDVVMGNDAPRYGYICTDTPVTGSPREEARTLYTLEAGAYVEFRELGRGSGVGWIMIAPANWVPFSSLCDW